MNRSADGLRKKTARIATALQELYSLPVSSQRRSNPLDVLIATILSQNTNDRNSDRAYRQLRKRFPSWKMLLKVPARSIAAAIHVGGLAQQKSTRIKRILQSLQREYGKLDLGFLNHMSNDEAYEFLISLRGVGPKTAACVLVFALKRDVFPVDTHIHRICARLGLTKSSRTPEQTFDEMKTLVPLGAAYTFHINLIRFGREICRSQNPLCSECPIFHECVFPQKKYFAELPARAFPRRKGEFMLLQRV